MQAERALWQSRLLVSVATPTMTWPNNTAASWEDGARTDDRLGT
jgi:hypothetical protein